MHNAPSQDGGVESLPSGRQLLERPFHHNGGNCWTVSLDFSGDDPLDPARSPLVLFEDGVELGPPHSSHGEIRMAGAGRYSHWESTLYFSASDNSNPNENGRCYEIEYSRTRYFDYHADYAAGILGFYMSHLGANWDVLRGAEVLEIGPGRQLGPALLMAGLGAHVSCVEKYHRGWNPDWHPFLIEALLRLIRRRGWVIDERPLILSLETASFDQDAIQILPYSIEDLPDSFRECWDISLSHSALEHVQDARIALRKLCNAMKKGAVGVHRIDFRDHRDFADPLGFLLLDDATFEEVTGSYKYTHGNRLRLRDQMIALAEAGFTRIEFLTEMTADPDYLARFIPLLRASGSKFAQISEDDLRPLSGVFLLRK